MNKDALVLKLPSLCSKPPDRRTWELLKSMAEVRNPSSVSSSRILYSHAFAWPQCTPVAVEVQLQKYIEECGPGRFSAVPHITEVMCKLPYGAHGSAANKALQLLKHCASQAHPALNPGLISAS